MKDRIKELAEKAGFRSNPDIYDRDQSFDISGFAESIIQECIHVIENTNDRYRKEYFADKIRKHFEV